MVGYYDEDEDDISLREEFEMIQCSCRFCVCMNTSEYGGTCPECSSGAHQG